MKGTGAGWDSCLYRAFVILGILGIVASTVVSALAFPDGSQMPLYIGLGSVAIFMVLLVGYWIVQIVFLGYGGLKAPDLAEKRDPNDLSILQNWNTLFNAMVTEGGNPELMKKAVKKGNSSLIIWFMWAAVIALCPIAMMLPYAFGILEWSYIRYAVMGYLGMVVFMAFLSVFLGGRSAQASEEVMLAPLGLRLVALPTVGVIGDRPRVQGGSVIEGVRFARVVRIEVQMGRVTTQVNYPAPVFVINGIEAQSGAPQAVLDALRKLRKAKRWEGLQILGDKNGITAARNSKGQNMWLYDLWLIERIVRELEKERAT
jgi:hypothetical protein